MFPLAALKITPMSFLLFKLKWPRQLAFAVFNVAIGGLLPYYINFKSFLFSNGQLGRADSFGVINKRLQNCICHRDSEGAVSHFWKQDRIMGKTLN